MAGDGFSITDGELEEIETAVLNAFEERSADGLSILGFGENGVAIAWPTVNPTLVVKRVISTDNDRDTQLLTEALETYVAGLSVHVDVAETALRAVPNAVGRNGIWLVQPLLRPEQLVESIMETAEPSADHPIVQAVTELILKSTENPRAVPDAQFSNFGWVDDRLLLFDVSPPFLFDEQGNYDFDASFIDRAMPGVLRPVARKKFVEIVSDIASRRGSFQQAVMSLVRVGQEQWIEPVLEAFNPHLDPPLTVEDVATRADRLHKDSQVLKKLMRAERFWSTRVRQRPYDIFITDSFTGELL
jgi:hypothetical protein